uniref:Urease accessory protein n=1 Tax=Ganoderma boninense TaxID=34458 RepID=A0A5K1JRJ9_9APHY
MAPAKIEQGQGRVVLRNGPSGNVFSELAATYPLKLLAPRLPSQNVSIVYMLSYGGGLVGGDRIRLDVEVHDAACLAILSQGSTKVFKTRPGQRLSANSQIHPVTAQYLNVRVAPASALFLLPDPVTCFRDAKYHQIQTFHLSKHSSAVLLDWVTSGRKSLGEEWVFSKYYSLIDVFVDNHRIAKDVMLLQERNSDEGSLTHRSLADSLAPIPATQRSSSMGRLFEMLYNTCQRRTTLSPSSSSTPPRLFSGPSAQCAPGRDA